MRVEPYSVGSFVHVVKRGARGFDIVRDDADRWRFVRSLYLLNDTFQSHNLMREIQDVDFLERPAHWPQREQLCSILAWTLMPNHFHLLLKETTEKGVAKFLQRLCGSMSMHFNEKYRERGSLFQGSYRSRTVDTNAYLQYLASYIVVKNTFELYPGGLKKAVENFEEAWKWAASYPFSSFQTIALGKNSPIIDIECLSELGLTRGTFKRNSRDMLLAHIEKKEDVPSTLLLEKW